MRAFVALTSQNFRLLTTFKQIVLNTYIDLVHDSENYPWFDEDLVWFNNYREFNALLQSRATDTPVEELVNFIANSDGEFIVEIIDSNVYIVYCEVEGVKELRSGVTVPSSTLLKAASKIKKCNKKLDDIAPFEIESQFSSELVIIND